MKIDLMHVSYIDKYRVYLNCVQSELVEIICNMNIESIRLY